MNRASNSVGHIGSAFDWGWENLQFLRMRLQGLNPASLLQANNAWTGFDAIGDDCIGT